MEQPLSASARVFATTELLESILLCLLEDIDSPTNREDVRSVTTQNNASILLHLLRLSEIGLVWRRCILHGSKPIQRELFVLAKAEDKRTWWQSKVLYSNQQSYYRGLAYRAPILNPIVQTSFPDYRFRYWRSGLGAEGPRHHAYLIISRRHIAHARERICDGHGKNVLDMVLSQPPPVQMEATIWERNDALKDFHERTTAIEEPLIQCDKGITLGIVLHRVGEMFDNHDDVTSFKITTV